MNFNSHSAVAGKHAFLSPSSYHWINYSEQKLEARYFSSAAAARGVALHELAHQAIKLGIKLSKVNKAISRYVNDAIGYKMEPEQVLYYSDNCFGTADAISFRRNVLRIHDLKTGIIKGSPHQLEVYAALFCLEYGVSPFDIRIEMRIYQGDNVDVYEGNADHILHIMDTIITFDKKIEFLKEETE